MHNLACDSKTRFTCVTGTVISNPKNFEFFYYAREVGATSIVLTASEQLAKRKLHKRLEMEWEPESTLNCIPFLRPDVLAAPQTMHIPGLQTLLASHFSRMQTLLNQTAANWKYS
jgi:hypothetical protein